MNKEEIEELAFKDRKELANLNELDLLEIIEFLQLDRKQWINQYSIAHNDYVDLQQENKKQKEVIDKTIEKLYCWGETLDPAFQKDLLDILKEGKND